MFGYILEFLNGEGPQAFFNLTMGQQRATQAQKEKRRLTWKRNHTSRHDHRAAVKVAADGPKHYCKYCKQQFVSHRSQKRHRCPYSKEVSKEGGFDKGKGPAQPQLKKNKPNPKTPRAAPNNLVPSTTTPPQAQKKQAQKPMKKKKKTTLTAASPRQPMPKPLPSGA
jgi:hypothetical protein